MATKFTVTIKPSGQGGDYTSLNSCEAGLQNNLSLSTIKVFSISAASTPTITAGTAVVGVTSGATGVCVLVNAARTQILIKTIAVAVFQSGEIVKKSTDAAVTVTLSNAGDLPILKMLYDGDWSAGHDTTAVIVNGTSFPIDGTQYIEIDSSSICRNYSAKWDTTRQVLSVTNAIALSIQDEFVRLNGLQVEVNATNADGQHVLHFGGIVAGGSEIWISNCILRGTASEAYTYSVLFISDVDIFIAKIWNVVLHHRGGTTPSDCVFSVSVQNLFLGNVTAYGSGSYGIYAGSTVAGTYYFRNVISANNTLFDFLFTTGPTYDIAFCASKDPSADDKGGANNRINQVISFADVANTDFRLLSTDSGAKGFGVNMVADPNIPYADDVGGRIRFDPWDIGSAMYCLPFTNRQVRYFLNILPEAHGGFDRLDAALLINVYPGMIIILSIGGSITPTGSLSKTITHLLALSGEITPAGTLTKGLFLSLDGSLTPTGSLTEHMIIVMSLGGELTPSGGITLSNPTWIPVEDNLRWMGEWSATHMPPYEVGDVVMYKTAEGNYHGFISRTPHNIGNIPTESYAHWARIVQARWKR